MSYPQLVVKPAKDQPFKTAEHLRHDKNESRASTKFVQLHRSDTTSGEAFVAIPDCEEPLNLAKKRKFTFNEQSDLNYEPFTQGQIQGGADVKDASPPPAIFNNALDK